MIKYQIEEHTWGAPAKVLAREGGKHIYNVKLSADADNCTFIARDAWLSLDLYSAKAASTFEGVIREKAANGNWYVEVVNPGDALFIYNVPMIEEEYNRNFMKESNFYNAAGDVVRAYELAVGDILEISAKGFTYEAKNGDSVNLSAGKLKKKA